MSGHTDSLVAAVQQLCEWRCGSLGLDGLSSLFVLSQLTQDAGGHALDVLDGRVQQLEKHSLGQSSTEVQSSDHGKCNINGNSEMTAVVLMSNFQHLIFQKFFFSPVQRVELC